MVRAKFYVMSKTQFATQHNDMVSFKIQLQPVYGDTPENKAFWNATPSGMIEMSVRPEVGEMFQPGQQFYVDFTPVQE